MGRDLVLVLVSRHFLFFKRVIKLVFILALCFFIGQGHLAFVYLTYILLLQLFLEYLFANLFEFLLIINSYAFKVVGKHVGALAKLLLHKLFAALLAGLGGLHVGFFL